MKGQKGFSLVELLVVVIIIGIIAAIAIPSLLSTLGAANEKAAVGTLRTIHSSETTYLSRNNEYGTLAELSSAGLLDGVVEGTAKSGYLFVMDADTAKFCVTASPESGEGKYFVIDTRGTVYTSDALITCVAQEAPEGLTPLGS